MLTVARPALANPPPAPAREDAGRSTSERSWYGWQILASDGVAGGLFVTAALTDSRAVLSTGIGVYALAAPTAHALHERPWPGVGSLALRVAIPGLLGFVGYGSVSCRTDYADDAEGAECADRRRAHGTVGLIVGATLATGLDASLIAFERAPAKRATVRAGSAPWDVAVSPILGREVLGLAVRGMF
jgi:hypothetical protein